MIYAITDKTGKFVCNVDEASFIELTERDVVLDATWDKHLTKYGHELFDNANSDYVLVGV